MLRSGLMVPVLSNRETYNMKWYTTLVISAAVAALPIANSMAADSYPSQPISLIVGFPPGGGADVLARTIAPKLEKQLGATIVVENKPGASGIIATQETSRKPANGYHLYLATPGSLTILPNMQKVSYDPAKFTAISVLVTMPNVLVTSAQSKLKTVEDVIAYAKTGKMTYASGGNGTIGQMAGEQFNMLADVKMQHIPYRGTSPALVDVAGGTVDVTFSDPSVKSLIKGGKLRPVAVTSTEPSGEFPDVPTVDGSGVKGFEVVNWYGVLGPEGMPADIVEKLNKALVTVMKDPEVIKTLALQGGMTATSSTPEEFAQLMANERKKWGTLVEKAGIAIE